jgi:hypothetical protein
LWGADDVVVGVVVVVLEEVDDLKLDFLIDDDDNVGVMVVLDIRCKDDKLVADLAVGTNPPPPPPVYVVVGDDV